MFRQFPPGTCFSVLAAGGEVLMTSRGPGRKWLDVELAGGKEGMMLCFDGPYCGDYNQFLQRLESHGGTVIEAAVTEIGAGMTALLMVDGTNVPFTIEGVVLN